MSVSDFDRLSQIEERFVALSAEARAAQIVHGRGAPFLACDDTRILTFDPGTDYDDRAFYFFAVRDIEFLLSFAGRAIRHARTQARQAAAQAPETPEHSGKDYAAECAMKCATPAFIAFLEGNYSLPPGADVDAIKARVRAALQVKSRGELNKDPAAAQRWRDIRAEFDAWSRQG